MDPLLTTALAAAEAAAAVHLRHFGSVGVDSAAEKGHSDFVSQVDLDAQEAALGVIARAYPGHAVLAEEEPEPGSRSPSGGGSSLIRDESEGSGYLWVVDPLDGTTNFLHRHPQFAASVGVWHRSAGDQGPPGFSHGPTMEAGAVVAPRTGERWWARRGEGAYKNGVPIRVSSTPTLKSALIGTGFPFKEPTLIPRYLGQFQRVLPASGGIRRCGSAALDLCYLAEGTLDAFWEEDYLSPWDVGAGLAILQEAGGVATRLDGKAIGVGSGSILAANSEGLLEELRSLVVGP